MHLKYYSMIFFIPSKKISFVWSEQVRTLRYQRSPFTIAWADPFLKDMMSVTFAKVIQMFLPDFKITHADMFFHSLKRPFQFPNKTKVFFFKVSVCCFVIQFLISLKCFQGQLLLFVHTKSKKRGDKHQ